MDRKKIDEILTAALRNVTGIVEARPLPADAFAPVIEKEVEAEKRSLMGLGKVVNTGIRDILNFELVYAALTSKEFDWGCHSALLLKKGRETVGQEVRDDAALAGSTEEKNVWFLHKNFVVYKDRISFPGDIMNKICHFEIPCLPAAFCLPDDDRVQCHAVHFASPSVLCDRFLKERCFPGENVAELGTIIIGARLHRDTGQ